MAQAKSVKPGTARWAELVREAIERDGNRNWFLGEAALEIAPMGKGRANTGSEEHLKEFADEIGVKYESLDQYRKTAAAWPQGTRVPSAAWKVHQMLAGHQELIEPGMTVTQAGAALGWADIRRVGSQASVEKRAEQVAVRLQDPEVREQLLADPGMSATLEQLQADQIHQDAKRKAQADTDAGKPVGWQPRTSTEREQRTERITNENPSARYFDQAEAVTDLSAALNKTTASANRHAEHIAECLDRMGDGSAGWDTISGLSENLAAAKQAVQELTKRLEDVQYYQEHGVSRMDAGLQRILKEGQ